MTGAAREVVRSARFLFVAWDGGGNLQPLLGLARILSARGHRVRALAWGTTAERVEAAGCEYVPIDEPAFDLGLRTWEDQEDDSLFVGRGIADMVLDHARGWPADVIVVDAFLRSALCGVEASGIATAALIHVQRAFFDFPRPDDPDTWGWDFPGVNAVRADLGLEPLPVADMRAMILLHSRCASALSVMPREFERPDLPIPGNVRHVGPIFEEDAVGWPDDLPWPPDASEPLVVVSFSTTYMRHEEILTRVLRALEPSGFRVLVTLGTSIGALEEHEIPAGPWVIRSYLPHLGVLPHASLVVTHAGMGTVMASFACGVPMLCIPGGRDQFANADRVQALDAGLALGVDPSFAEITDAIGEALTLERIRTGAARMAEITASYEGGERAVRELERLLVG